MFGVSGFLLGNGNSWIAKVGGKTITYNSFIEKYQNERDMIYQTQSDKIGKEDLLKYLNSDQFKQDSLSRIVMRDLVSSLQEEFEIYPNKNLILRQIVKSPALQDVDGKFDRALYQNFLRNSGLSEKEHLVNLSNEVFGSLVSGIFSSKTKTDDSLVKDLYQHQFQTRIIDSITISKKNIGNVKTPNKEQLVEFFKDNQSKFTVPQMRKVEFISFNINDLKGEVKVSEEEISAQYEANKSDYRTIQKANFYQVLFDEKEKAEEFSQKLSSKTTNKEQEFVKLSAEIGKDKPEITLNGVSKNQFPKEIVQAFNLKEGEVSQILESGLGFHIFYLKNTIPAKDLTLEEVRDEITESLLSAKENSQIGDALRIVEDEILATNSLEKVAAKIKVKINSDLPKFDEQGKDFSGKEIAEIAALEGFAKNSFSLQKDRVSKILASKSNKKYYILFVKEIEQERKKTLNEVKSKVISLWVKEKLQEKMQELAEKVSEEIKQRTTNVSQIVAKNKLKLETSELPRFYMVDSGNGQKVPYSDASIKEIFQLKIGQSSTPRKISSDKIVITILREIKTPKIDSEKLQNLKLKIEDEFASEIGMSFDGYIQAKFPIKVNRELLDGLNQQN
ncbi:MAG: peptidyl-prolyl cis-trans isomerase D [Lentimonas sp.]|jgi:peptidyl-prolyl cis-trans isomerase D